MIPRAHRPALAAIAALAVTTSAVAATTVPFRGHTSSLTVITGGGEVTVAGAGSRIGTLRVRYTVPRTWKRQTTLNAASIRYLTTSSCGHRVTISGRLALGPDVPAAQRVETLLPRSTGTIRTSGTRDGAAFRVLRVRGSATVRGVLVQPLSATFAPPRAAGQRIYAELRATATADPSRECHAGGPRSVGDALGDAFGLGGAGGFATK